MRLEKICETIEQEAGVLLYFSGEHCQVCRALRPKFETLFSNRFPMIKQIYLDAHENGEISAYFNVFSVPTAIVFLDGKEFVREGRAVSLCALEEKLKRPYALLFDA